MCGIVGIFNHSGGSQLVSEGQLKAMTDEIQHRGPDDDGLYISQDQRVGLGFRRLSIIDLSPAGHQPMSTEDGSVWIVFNGEIYNHLDIRKDLEEKGYHYRSRTDTETILYAYCEYGAEFVHRLLGMFAIAIWDSRSGELLLVRDRIGVKPLYYTQQQGGLFFGSEIKAIVKHPSIERRMNRQGLYDYLSLLTTPPGESMFEGIHKLEAGHMLTVGSDGAIRMRRYWDLFNTSPVPSGPATMDEGYYIERIRELLRESIRARMMSDVPFGVLLSGGIDSSLNVALMAELMTRPVDTFTVGFKDLEKYNELGYARQVASQFATNHHEIMLDEAAAIDFLPRMVWHQDEPNADPVCMPMYFVSKLARDSGTIVVQVGEGSDEQFSGYQHYLRELRYHSYYYELLPKPLKHLAYGTMKAFIPDSMLTEYARRASRSDASFYGGAISVTEEAKRKLLAPEFRRSAEGTGRIADKYFRQIGEISRNGNDQLRKMIYFEFKSRLAELLLMRVDKMSMATSIEARVPFLDHRLVEFSMQIPSALKVKDGIPKYILKKAAEGIIPNNIIYRKKQGFAAPVSEWLRNGRLSGFAYERIMESKIMGEQVFNGKQIEFLFDQHRNGKRNFSLQIWTLLVVSMWYDTYIA